MKKKISSRGKFSEFIANMPICSIYMQACGSSNYWGRKFTTFGHTVKLINPKYVKPFVKRNKNDANDAEGIAAAAMSPNMSQEEKTRPGLCYTIAPHTTSSI